MTPTPRDNSGGLLGVFRRNPHWRRLYLARTISLFGDWFNALAIIHLLGNGERAPALALAVVFVLKQLPVFLLGPLAGVVADRAHRKKILITCDLLAALTVLGFLLTSKGNLLPIYALTAMQISLAAFAEPARQALTPTLVGMDDLLEANALSSATWSLMFTLGSAMGALVLALVGWRAAIMIDAITYLLSAGILAGLPFNLTRAPKRLHAKAKGILSLLGWNDIREGLRFIRNHQDVRRIILVKFGWGSMGAISLFLTLLGTEKAFRIQGSADLGVGFLWMCRGLGTGIGPFIARWYAGDNPDQLQKTLTFAFFAAPLLYLVVALSPTPWMAGTFVFLAHLGGSTLWVISTVLLQRIVPEHVRGRTFAAELGLVMLSSATSQIVYSLLLDKVGLSLRTTIFLAATLCLIPATLWFFSRKRLATQAA
ncbi:MAG TPA: MFS transporter [Planctomycetes bacterium]|nr:MFS transporter [Planctomycetota bacterium]